MFPIWAKKKLFQYSVSESKESVADEIRSNQRKKKTRVSQLHTLFCSIFKKMFQKSFDQICSSSSSIYINNILSVFFKNNNNKHYLPDRPTNNNTYYRGCRGDVKVCVWSEKFYPWIHWGKNPFFCSIMKLFVCRLLGCCSCRYRSLKNSFNFSTKNNLMMMMIPNDGIIWLLLKYLKILKFSI